MTQSMSDLTEADELSVWLPSGTTLWPRPKLTPAVSAPILDTIDEIEEDIYQFAKSQVRESCFVFHFCYIIY